MMMATATSLKEQTHTTKTSTIKVITISTKTINTVPSMASTVAMTKEMVATMMNRKVLHLYI